MPTTVYVPVGARLSGMLSGVMVITVPLTPTIRVRNPERLCPTGGFPMPLLGTTIVIVPLAVKLLGLVLPGAVGSIVVNVFGGPIFAVGPYWKIGV